MTNYLTIHPGPQEYICSEGVLATLPIRLRELGITHVLISHGSISWETAKPFLDELLQSDIVVDEFHFAGEATDLVISEISNRVKETGAQAIIGVGGGKVQDTAKYAAYLNNCLPFISIPTLASNCAPWSSVTVIYNSDGSMDRLDVLPVQAQLLLIEPRLILDSPKDFLIAGMADTLAKWYESDAILSETENQDSPMLMMARSATALCKTIILERGIKALEDLSSQRLSKDFMAVVEVIISISGTVGGFGDYLARTTIAHEIHDALTVFPETHHFLHGHKVGYGILVQLAVEEKWSEIEKLKQFYAPLEIPGSLEEMGLTYLNEEQLRSIGVFATRPDSPVNMHPAHVDADIIVQAIENLEKTNKQRNLNKFSYNETIK